MRSLVAIGIAALAAGCGARSGLEVDPAASVDAGSRPDVVAFDTFTCRWSYAAEPWTIHARTSVAAVRRAVMHPERRVGLVGVGEELVAFDTDPPPSTGMYGSVPFERAGLGWPSRDGWHLFGAEGRACVARSWDFELVAALGERVVETGECAYDPLGDAVAIVQQAPEDDELIVTSVRSEGPLVPSLVGRFPGLLGDQTPRFALATDGTLWIATHSGEGVRLHAIRDGRVAATSAPLDPVSVAAPLAPDRLRGGVVAALHGAGALRLVRATLAGDRVELLELGAIEPMEPEPPLEIVTTESEILLARADGSYTSVPLSGAAPRTIPSPESGATRGALALRPGTSTGGVVYAVPGAIRYRPLACNR